MRRGRKDDGDMLGDSEKEEAAALLRHAAPITFVPHSDLTHKNIEGIDVSNTSVQRSLFTGSILRGCTFTKVDFSRCDLDGVLVEDCTFIECSFEADDIRSSSFSRSAFRKCDISNAFLSDCAFSSVEFDGTSFEGMIAVDCSFTKCKLKSATLAKGSFTQNRFRTCHFHDVLLGDCTFQYILLTGCTFDKSRMNAESIGLTFGLTRQDLRHLELLYLGQEAGALPVDVDPVPMLVEAYRKRKWSLGVMLMSIGFGLMSTVSAVRVFLRATRERVSAGIVIKRDDLVFFATVLEELAADKALPLMSCVDVIETINALAAEIELNPRPDNTHTASTLQMIASKMTLILDSMIEAFESERLPADVDTEDQQEIITFTLRERPETSVAAFLNEVAAASGLPVSNRSKTLEITDGSYVECVETTLLTAVAFLVLLYVMNGCIIQIAEMRERIQALTTPKRRLPMRVRSALQPHQGFSRFLLVPMQKLIAYLGSVPWLVDPRLKGFSKENLVAARREQAPRSSQVGRGEEK